MKATGIVRSVDQLGRVVIPMETRKKLNIKNGDEVEIYTEGTSVVIKKYSTKCVFCGCEEKEMLKEYVGVCICKDCLGKLNK